MKKTKTQLRAEWILANQEALLKSRTEVSDSKRGGTNAKYREGMSSGGWGYWAQAFRLAKIGCNRMNYWSGSSPTPSTAINKGFADFISENAPKEIL